jgi:hypothetical protein
MALGRTALHIAVVTGLLVKVGCGGGDSGGSGPSHGVSGSKPANQLTPQEVRAITDDAQARRSEAVRSTFNASPEQFCKMTGLKAGAADSASVSLCEIVRDRCLDDPPSYGYTSGSSLDASAYQAPAPTAAELYNCTVTVDEIDACVNAQIASTQQAAQQELDQLTRYEGYTCNDVALVDTSSLTGSLDGGTTSQATPPACQSVYVNCPVLEFYW